MGQRSRTRGRKPGSFRHDQGCPLWVESRRSTPKWRASACQSIAVIGSATHGLSSRSRGLKRNPYFDSTPYAPAFVGAWDPLCEGASIRAVLHQLGRRMAPHVYAPVGDHQQRKQRCADRQSAPRSPSVRSHRARISSGSRTYALLRIARMTSQLNKAPRRSIGRSKSKNSTTRHSGVSLCTSCS